MHAIDIPENIYNQILVQLQNLKQIEDALPIVKLQDVNIVVDKSGRVYLPDELTGTIALAYLNYSVSIPVKSIVYKHEETAPWFKLRYKFVGYGSLNQYKEFRQGIALAMEPLQIKGIGLNFFVGTLSTGSALSLNITRNFGVAFGAGLRYTDLKIAPVALVGFAF